MNLSHVITFWKHSLVRIKHHAPDIPSARLSVIGRVSLLYLDNGSIWQRIRCVALCRWTSLGTVLVLWLVMASSSANGRVWSCARRLSQAESSRRPMDTPDGRWSPVSLLSAGSLSSLLCCLQKTTAVHLFEHPQSHPQGHTSLSVRICLGLRHVLPTANSAMLNAILGLRSVICQPSQSRRICSRPMLYWPQLFKE